MPLEFFDLLLGLLDPLQLHTQKNALRLIRPAAQRLREFDPLRAHSAER
jgi:hypothetical protein